jgi:hypothetical protein
MNLDSLTTYGGVYYTPEELDAAFDKVKNPTHWKDPIEAVIDDADIAIVTAAIIHFTGTVPEFFHEKGKTYVAADGYRAGPCGDF